MTTPEKWSRFWFFFNGISALIGTGMMWFGAEQFGMTPLLALMQQNLPFADVFFTGWLWPGLFLLTLIGLPHLIGVVLLAQRSASAGWWAIGSGTILVGWTALQIVIAFGPNPLSIIYLLIGLLEVPIGVLILRAPRR